MSEVSDCGPPSSLQTASTNVRQRSRLLCLAETMKVLYPASHDIPRLSQELLALKIARHSRCSSCSSCSGLRPPPDVEVALDSEIQPESQEHSAHGPYLQLCSCGHDVLAHGADPSSIGVEEFARRSRVAVRLDELLEVSSCYVDGLPRQDLDLLVVQVWALWPWQSTC